MWKWSQTIKGGHVTGRHFKDSASKKQYTNRQTTTVAAVAAAVVSFSFSISARILPSMHRGTEARLPDHCVVPLMSARWQWSILTAVRLWPCSDVEHKSFRLKGPFTQKWTFLPPTQQIQVAVTIPDPRTAEKIIPTTTAAATAHFVSNPLVGHIVH